MRRLIVLLAVLALSGCFDNSGTEPIVSLNGLWGGFVGNQEFKLGLGETNGVVTGSGTITSPSTGARGVTVSGTYEKGTTGHLNVMLSNGSTLSVNLVAEVSLLSMAGTLNGSGYNGNVITLNRQ